VERTISPMEEERRRPEARAARAAVDGTDWGGSGEKGRCVGVKSGGLASFMHAKGRVHVFSH
jgi:hypothetical protein